MLHQQRWVSQQHRRVKFEAALTSIRYGQDPQKIFG